MCVFNDKINFSHVRFVPINKNFVAIGRFSKSILIITIKCQKCTIFELVFAADYKQTMLKYKNRCNGCGNCLLRRPK